MNTKTRAAAVLVGLQLSVTCFAADSSLVDLDVVVDPGTPALCVAALADAKPHKAKEATELAASRMLLTTPKHFEAMVGLEGLKPSASRDAALAVAYLMQRQVPKATGLLGKLVAEHGEDPCLMRTAAMQAAMLGQRETARRRVDVAVKGAPNDVQSAVLQGILVSEQDGPRAIELLQAATDAHPESPLAPLHLGLLLAKDGDLAGAQGAMGKAYDRGMTSVAGHLAELAIAGKDYGRYLQLMAAAEAEQEDGAGPMDWMGDLGAADKAWGAYREALEWPEGTTLRASIVTNQGTLRCDLFPESAPVTVANFVGLANGKQSWKHMNGVAGEGALYSGSILHRVIPEFMVQGGDPEGTGMGGPGYRFVDEITPALAFDRPGRLAMANSGPATNGSQWFITEVPTPHLSGKHTIFGQCEPDAIVRIKGIARLPRGDADRPVEPIVVEQVLIEAVPPL